MTRQLVRSENRARFYAVLVTLLAALLGCSSEEEGSEATQAVHRRPQPSHFDAEIRFPVGFDQANVVLHGAKDLDIGENVTLASRAGSRPPSLNVGEATFEVGRDSKTGTVVSGGRLELERRSRVEGDAQAALGIQIAPGAAVTGAQRPNTPLGSLAVVPLSVDFPTPTSSFRVRSRQQRTIEPGTYKTVDVDRHGTLTLRVGIYYLDELNVDAGATLKLDASPGPVIVYVRGSVRYAGRLDGPPERMFLGYFGRSPLAIDSTFRGTIVAPNARLRLASVGHPGHEGSFFAKELEAGEEARHRGHGHQVRPTRITHVPFGHWDSVVPPKLFVNCVMQLAPNRFAALFGYENPFAVPVTIPLGNENRVTPAPSTGVVPPTVFSPGRHDRAFWAPIEGSDVTWLVRTSTATASSASTRCTSDSAYPVDPDTANRSVGEHASNPSPLLPKPSRDFKDDVHSVALLQVPGNSGPQAAPPTPPTIPFVVRLTAVIAGDDGCLASRHGDVRVVIDGVDAGRQHIYDDDCVHCVDTCGLRERNLNNEFSVNIPSDQAEVRVRIRLIEQDDGSDDEDLLDTTITVDNQNGREGECAVANDRWVLCFEFEHTGVPTNIVQPRICTSWNAAYVDSGLGEDDGGEAVSGEAISRYDASFTGFGLAVTGPLTGSFSTQGFLDAEGCIPPALMQSIPPEAFVFRKGADPGDPEGLTLSLTTNTSNTNPAGLPGGFSRPDGVNYDVVTATVTGIDSTTLVHTFRHDSEQVVMQASTPGDVPLDTWTGTGAWVVPPARVDLVSPTHTGATRVAATVSTMLAREDTGIVPGDYGVIQNTGCEYVFNNLDSCGGNPMKVGPPVEPTNTTSCMTNADCTPPTVCTLGRCLQTCTEDADCGPGLLQCFRQTVLDGTLQATHPSQRIPCEPGATYPCACLWPDQSLWKFITAHEAGHQIQRAAIGQLAEYAYLFTCPPGMNCTGERSQDPGDITRFPNEADRPLVDPPFVDSMAPLCGCQHVDAANALHCLQSIERGGGAQVEGFAQFFSSRIWNRQDETDCWFGYYKEFLLSPEMPCSAGGFCTPFGSSGLNVQRPPVPVSCLTEHKWRNRRCPMAENAEMGTEIDWMAFLYNVNSVGDQPMRVLMDDIFAIQRHACGGPPAGATPPPCWAAFPAGWLWKPPVVAEAPVSCGTNSACPIWSCLDDLPESTSPCTDGSCLCKSQAGTGVRTLQPPVACTVSADCPTWSCVDDAQASAAPCTDGSCLCKTLPMGQLPVAPAPATSCLKDGPDVDTFLDAPCPDWRCINAAPGATNPCNPSADAACSCRASQTGTRTLGQCRYDSDCPKWYCLDDAVDSAAECADNTCLCKTPPQSGFFTGAELRFSGDLAKRDRIEELGDRFGVNLDLTP